VGRAHVRASHLVSALAPSASVALNFSYHYDRSIPPAEVEALKKYYSTRYQRQKIANSVGGFCASGTGAPRASIARFSAPRAFAIAGSSRITSIYWQVDSDAVNSIDSNEAMLWFISRGVECLNCGKNRSSFLCLMNH
jgi:hypothetical protein